MGASAVRPSVHHALIYCCARAWVGRVCEAITIHSAPHAFYSGCIYCARWGASSWQTQVLVRACSCNRKAKRLRLAREWLSVLVHIAIHAASDRLGAHAANTSSIVQLSRVCGERASRWHLMGDASASHFGVRVVGKLNDSSLHVAAIGMPGCSYLLAGNWAFSRAARSTPRATS